MAAQISGLHKLFADIAKVSYMPKGHGAAFGRRSLHRAGEAGPAAGPAANAAPALLAPSSKLCPKHTAINLKLTTADNKNSLQ